MSSEEDNTGLNSGVPGAEIPYSVSMPITFGMAMGTSNASMKGDLATRYYLGTPRTRV